MNRGDRNYVLTDEELEEKSDAVHGLLSAALCDDHEQANVCMYAGATRCAVMSLCADRFHQDVETDMVDAFFERHAELEAS